MLSLCIGRLIPELGRRFPNQHVDFFFGTATAPFLKMMSNGVSLRSILNLDVYLSPWKQQTSSLARLGRHLCLVHPVKGFL